MLWLDNLLQLFWEQLYLAGFVQDVFVSSYIPKSLKTTICIILITFVRNHLKRVTTPVSYLLLTCSFGQRAQSPGQGGRHAPRPPDISEARLPESAPGCGPCAGPQVKAVKTWVGKGEEGWRGVIWASVCACLFSSHNYSARLEVGCENYV